MPNERLQNAVNGLKSYFELSTREDLLQELAVQTLNPTGTSNTTPVGAVGSALLSVVEGGLTTQQIIKKLNDYASAQPEAVAQISELVRVFASSNAGTLDGQEKIFAMDEIIGRSSSAGPSVIMMNTARTLPSARDVNAISLFLNTIPSHELARCVPYLSVEVQTKRPGASDGRLTNVSLMKFLLGADHVNAKPDIAMKNANEIRVSAEGNQVLEGFAGMELFTSPQTLVNIDNATASNTSHLRAANVIDPFRPFLSIDEMALNVVPAAGILAYKSGHLKMTLHDRSRLADIAEFVAPDLYRNAELLIEFGWSHPSEFNGEDNPYGAILTAMRSREKYRVVNSSFSFTQTGEVKIDVSIWMKGSSDFNVLKIGQGGDSEANQEIVRKLQKTITRAREVLTSKKNPGIKEVRGQIDFYSSVEDTLGNLAWIPELKNELMKADKQGGLSNLKELRKILVKIFGKDGTGSKKTRKLLDTAIRREIEKRFDLFDRSNARSPEPLLDPFLDVDRILRGEREAKTGTRVFEGEYVSLGKLFSIFIGIPLAESGQFDDVQMIYYPFNQHAGRIRGANIAEFAIETKRLKNQLLKYGTARKNINLPLRDFIQFVTNNFIDDMSSVNYGLNDIYRRQKETEDGRTVIRVANKRTENDLASYIEQRMRKLGLPDGTYKQPIVDFMIEAVPVGRTDSSQLIDVSREKTVLRIHIFDKVASAYESQSSLLAAARDETLRTIGLWAADKKTDDPGEYRKLFNKIIAKAKEADLFEVPKQEADSVQDKVFNIKGGPDAVKNFIRKTMPTITYGSNLTAVKSANLKTMQDARLATVHMQRAGDQGPTSPQGTDPGNLPLTTLPAMLDMNIFGCPLINFAQQFFVDFGTGTTIDNVYGVVKLNHLIKAGKFDTKISFVPIDSWGKYRALGNTIGSMIRQLDDLEDVNSP